MQRFARRNALTLLMFGALATSIGTAGASFAFFTDTETVDGTFTSGTVILDDVKVDALSLSTGSMMPGGSITDDVVVENDGTAELRYDLTVATVDTTSPSGGPLYDVLTITVRGIDSTTPASPCNDFDGSSILATTTLGATTSISLDRVLNAGASETLCVRVSLPSATGNAYQGATATSTFTFAAEQTANNP